MNQVLGAIKPLEAKTRFVMSKVNAIYKRGRFMFASHPGSFVAAVAICGLAVAFPQFFPIFTQSDGLSSNHVAAQENTVPTGNSDNSDSKTTSTGPTQSDARFAANPNWSQDFTGKTAGTLDPAFWNVLIGPAENSNNEQQYYNDSAANLRIENGALRLIATHEPKPKGYKYGSARLETQGKKSFLYGRIDISAKLPGGVGTWPAVWLLPANDTYAKKDPVGNAPRYKNGGEIDIIEAVGFEPNVNYSVAHTASDAALRADGTGSHRAIYVPRSQTSFNTYTLLWTPTTLTFEVNGEAYFTYSRQANADYTTWPFDQPFYLIANLAMGGSWGGMDTKHFPGNGIDNSALPASLDIQSIHYYPYVGQ